MFKRVLIQKSVEHHPQTKTIQNRFQHLPSLSFDKLSDVFGSYKKPYLQKRDNLSLILAQKEGALVKLAPDAYGQAGEPHYYFSNISNCIYECVYCYLQGYFHSPDIVVYVNMDEITQEISQIAKTHPQGVWFHAGEFSDSLALSHLTNEMDHYYKLFENIPWAKLELRSKSVNIKPLLEKKPLDNIIVSFSLSDLKSSQELDLKTPNSSKRIEALQKLSSHGHPIAIHLDPICYNASFLESYQALLEELFQKISPESLQYISLGVVRFTDQVYYSFLKNYPNHSLQKQEFVKSFDGKMRYPRPLRNWIFDKLESMLTQYGVERSRIYRCMEN